MPPVHKANRDRQSRLMSQTAASQFLGMTRASVMIRVANGEIEAEMVDTTPVLVRASVEEYAKRQRSARPEGVVAAVG